MLTVKKIGDSSSELSPVDLQSLLFYQPFLHRSDLTRNIHSFGHVNWKDYRLTKSGMIYTIN